MAQQVNPPRNWNIFGLYLKYIRPLVAELPPNNLILGHTDKRQTDQQRDATKKVPL